MKFIQLVVERSKNRISVQEELEREVEDVVEEREVVQLGRTSGKLVKLAPLARISVTVSTSIHIPV